MLSSRDIANHTGLSDRTIREWHARGILPKTDDLTTAVRGIVAYLKDEKEKKPDKNSLYLEEVRLTKARADKVELEIAEKEATLISATEVVKLWSDYILACRAKLLSIPTKLAYELAGEQNPIAIEGILREVIDESLGELAEESFVRGATATNSDGDGLSPATAVDAE